jgi:outer membrane protein assembly factor BamB
MSLRNQDTVLIADWKTRRVLWTWGQGQISGPHDATLLRSGNVLVFDNGLGRGWSRVVEVDPRTDELVWEYRAPEGETFFTATRGAAQRLANGNTLITDSERGRVFEVTPSGNVVWDFRNPNRDGEGKPYIIVRMRRLPKPLTPDAPFAWSD